MKVNLKKIGAIVAGATILASSAAFAGLMFGSTTLVDNNGAPVAKVVVGSNAQPSDGVAAALIAGKMVSEAYKSATLTATVSGEAACTASGEGSGTCAISNEKAKLEITVPNTVAAGTWTGDNLIGDYLNRELLDRLPNSADVGTDSAYTAGSIDTTENANPFTDGETGSLGPSEIYMYRVGGTQFTPFESSTVTDPDSSNSYTESQYLWLKGDNHFDTDVEDVVGVIDFLAYTLKFDGPGSEEIGIPYCSKANGTDYTSCTEDYLTETHKVKIKFLGEDWIISDMTLPGTTSTTENDIDDGGEVWLAKEAVSGILNQGESLPIDDLKFQLDDLEAHGDTTSAILSILDANGNVLEKDTVAPATTKEFNVNGKTYRFHVYKVAPGYTFGAKWADVAIFSQELELDSGEELDMSNNKNSGYQVTLGWKNNGATSAAADDDVDSLRTIIIYSDDMDEISSSGDEVLGVGDYLSVVQDPAAWKLTYKGLDLADDDRVGLKFQLKESDETISATHGPYNATSGGTQQNCTIEAPYLLVSSDANNAVFVADREDLSVTDGLASNEFIVALAGATCGIYVAGTLNAGSLFMRTSVSGDWGYNNYSASGPMKVEYSTIGDGDTNFDPSSTSPGGAIVFHNATLGIADAGLGELLNYSGAGNGTTVVMNDVSGVWFAAIAEKAYPDEFADYWTLGIDGISASSPADATFDVDLFNGTTYVMSDNEELGYFYAGAVTSNWTGVKADVKFVSERGSKLSSVSADSIKLEMAHELAHAAWFLAASGSSVEDASKTLVTLGEGESTTVSGVTVKVLEITETVGACSAAGGAPACTADMSGVSAVIMPNNAATVAVAMPYTGTYGNLVVLDSDAVGVNTLVSVGGDKVNSVTAGLLQGTPVDWSAERKVVREVVQGSKIVVAGKDAADTLEAAQDFVAQLQKVQ